jgi:hypothetical protein
VDIQRALKRPFKPSLVHSKVKMVHKNPRARRRPDAAYFLKGPRAILSSRLYSTTDLTFVTPCLSLPPTATRAGTLRLRPRPQPALRPAPLRPSSSRTPRSCLNKAVANSQTPLHPSTWLRSLILTNTMVVPGSRDLASSRRRIGPVCGYMDI